MQMSSSVNRNKQSFEVNYSSARDVLLFGDNMLHLTLALNGIMEIRNI